MEHANVAVGSPVFIIKQTVKHEIVSFVHLWPKSSLRVHSNQCYLCQTLTQALSSHGTWSRNLLREYQPWQIFRFDTPKHQVMRYLDKVPPFHQNLCIWFEMPIERIAFLLRLCCKSIVTSSSTANNSSKCQLKLE